MLESLNKDSCTRVDLLVNWFRRAPLVETRSNRWSMVVRVLSLFAKAIFWTNSTRVRCKNINAECIRSRYPTAGNTSSNPGSLISKNLQIRGSKHRLPGLKPYLHKRSFASLFRSCSYRFDVLTQVKRIIFACYRCFKHSLLKTFSNLLQISITRVTDVLR